jgi:hypothetical protein
VPGTRLALSACGPECVQFFTIDLHLSGTTCAPAPGIRR